MRTITITKTIYDFDELSEKAKESAANIIFQRYADFERETYIEDYRNTLEEMEKVLRIDIKSWDVEGEGRYDYRFDFVNYRWDNWLCEDYEVNPKYLVRFLNNEVFPMIKGKYYGKLIRKEDGSYEHKKRYSRIRMENTGCLLTGVYTDGVFDSAIYNAYYYVKERYSIDDFIRAILDDFFNEWGKFLDYLYTDEFVLDTIDSIGLEFYEDGTIYGEE